MLDQGFQRGASKPSAQQFEESYHELVQQGVIEVNTRNLLTVMRHLNSVNWGTWELPSMDQSYQARQHDCNGHQVVTIDLDKGIMVDGQLIRRFQLGAPRGFLSKYVNIARI